MLGKDPYNKKNVDAATTASNKVVGILENYLLRNTFLVTEKLTLADIFAASIISRGYQFVCILKLLGNPVLSLLTILGL